MNYIGKWNSIYVHKTKNLIHQSWRWGKYKPIPRKSHLCIFDGPTFGIGYTEPVFPPLHSLSICSGKPPLASQQPVWIFLAPFFFSESLAGLLRKRLLPPFWCQDCCSSFLSSSICCYFPACRFRKRTEKFASQGHAWGRIFFDRCSFSRTWFGTINSWRPSFIRIAVNFSHCFHSMLQLVNCYVGGQKFHIR